MLKTTFEKLKEEIAAEIKDFLSNVPFPTGEKAYYLKELGDEFSKECGIKTEIFYCAGLHRLDFVFYFSSTPGGTIVEAFAYDKETIVFY